ncbi:NAD-dependent epimerase/dehydratase family protein [Methylobacterium oryzisoli]|uniref:NAD-dependent epimerase/dehydratase family protein n=1 Tax=Methylobacterium oryzisoli TaxID=3385502 RepID=UPI003891C257
MSERVGEAAPGPVLVTGASGKIGRFVVEELVQRGYRVRALTSRNRDPEGAPEGVEWRTKDFMQSLDLDEEVAGCAAVIHLAAEIADTSRMQRVNVEATRALAEASERAGVKVFCHTSTVSVYGSSVSRLVTEDSPTLTAHKDVRPEYIAPEFLRTYGRTKLLGEAALRGEARSVRYVIARPTVVIDVEDIVRLGQLGTLRKSLIARRHAHHIGIRDVAHALVWLMERGLSGSGAPGEVAVYNIAEDEFPDSSYEMIFRKLYASTSQGAFQMRPAPGVVDRLTNAMRLGVLPVRYSFGQMQFSADKLKREGYRIQFGLASVYGQAIREIMAGAASRH